MAKKGHKLDSAGNPWAIIITLSSEIVSVRERCGCKEVVMFIIMVLNP